jgi:putative inorganic carbon (hco3(-)) transporter
LFRWTIVLPLAFYMLARLMLQHLYDRELLAALFVVGAVIASTIAIVDGLLGGGIAADAAVRLSGMAPHPNALALYLERAAVVALLLAVLYRERISLWWLGSGSLVALVTLLTLSRGAFLGMTVGLLTILVITQLRKQALYVGAGALAVLAVFVAAVPERALSLLGGGSGSLRLELWRSSLQMVRDHPWSGVGLDQFLYQYLPRYVTPEAWPERFTSHPHNLVLEAWLSLGIIGLVLLALLAALWVRSVRLGISTTDRLTLAGCGALAAIFVHGLLDRSYFLPELAVSTWLLILLLRVEDDRAT